MTHMIDISDAQTIHGWAVRRPDGHIVVEVGEDITEATIWTIALGWPSAEQIEDAKRAGGRAFRCAVVDVSEDTKQAAAHHHARLVARSQ